MSLLPIRHRGIDYRVAFDGPPFADALLQAVVRARVIDEITGDGVRGISSVLCSMGALIPRIAADGVVGLAGHPRRDFRDPGGSPFALRLEIRAAGYLPLTRTLDLDAGSALPLALGDLAMHREAVVLSGRVVRETDPVSGARVRICEVWRTPPGPGEESAGSPPSVVAIRPGLHRNIPSGVLRRRDVAAVLGEDLTLDRAVHPGATRLHTTDRIHLNPGDWILLEPEEPDRCEYHRITEVLSTGPAILNLAYPLSRVHRPGSIVRRVIPGAAGPDNILADAAGEEDETRDRAVAGDRCLFLETMDGLSGIETTEVVAGTHEELHGMEHFFTRTDDDGRFRLPPLSRVAQVALEADEGGLTEPIRQTVGLRCGRAVQTIDLVRRREPL